MTRTKKLRLVFRELRRSAPSGTPARELLECASKLVDAFGPRADNSRFECFVGGLPFDCQALDVAFSDGGWRVLEYQRSCGHAFDDDDYIARSRFADLPLIPQEFA